MKVFALEEKEIVPGVVLLRESVVQMPLAAISDGGLFDGLLEADDGYAFGVDAPRALGPSPSGRGGDDPIETTASRLGPVRYRPDDAMRRSAGKPRTVARAIIGYFDTRSALRFLRWNFVPTVATNDLDRTVRQARLHGWSRGFEARIEEILRKIVADIDTPSLRDEPRPAPLVPMDTLSEWYSLVPTPTGRGGRLVRRYGVTHLRVVAAPEVMDLDGHRIPRSSFLVRVRNDPQPFVAWDGRTERPYLDGSIERLPSDLLETLDRHGTLYGATAIDTLPAPHLAARYVLRIPSRAEARKVQPKAMRSGLLTAAAAVLVDPRSPIRIPRGTPVIDDPAEALGVLAYTARRLHVPPAEADDLLPFWDLSPLLETKPRYLLALDVAA